MIDLELDDGVYVLRMRHGENRLSLPFVEALSEALDEVEKATSPVALVTVGEGHLYSNGLDLAWMQAQEVSQRAKFGALLQRTFARLVAFPAVTVAAQNGHAFAAGAVLAMVHDFRVMRSDRGFFCLPEVDLRIPLSPGVMGILQARLDAPVLHDALTTGRRYTAGEALEARIVDAAVPEAEVLPQAVAMARALHEKDPPTLAAIKRGLYEPVLQALEADARSQEPRA